MKTTSSAAFACKSRACAPPPVGTGGSTGGGRAPLSPTSARSLLKNELAGIGKAETQKIDDGTGRKKGSFLSKGVRIAPRGNGSKHLVIKAGEHDEVAQKQLFSNLKSITDKLQGAGYEVQPVYRTHRFKVLTEHIDSIEAFWNGT